MNEFKQYHPIVNFIYFLFVIGFSCFLMHPVCLGISLVCGFVYSVMLKGKGTIKTNAIYLIPMLIIMGIINPVFNHQGVTVIYRFSNGTPLTAESILYGLCGATMIVSVIFHFSCYNQVMTSDKFIYLFGKILPSLTLVLSMTLQFVPKFAAQLKVVTNAQKCMGRDMSEGSLIKRAKQGLNIISIMTSWSFENAIETADSMKSRGYGTGRRTSFSVFTFHKWDRMALVCILLLGGYLFTGTLMGGMEFHFFPSMKGADISLYSISLFAAYLLLCMCPIIIELTEVIKWSSFKSKM